MVLWDQYLLHLLFTPITRAWLLKQLLIFFSMVILFLFTAMTCLYGHSPISDNLEAKQQVSKGCYLGFPHHFPCLLQSDDCAKERFLASPTISGRPYRYMLDAIPVQVIAGPVKLSSVLWLPVGSSPSGLYIVLCPDPTWSMLLSSLYHPSAICSLSSF